MRLASLWTRVMRSVSSYAVRTRASAACRAAVDSIWRCEAQSKSQRVSAATDSEKAVASFGAHLSELHNFTLERIVAGVNSSKFV